MGILPKHLELLAIERKINPNLIKGAVLTLGQQSVHATLDEVLTIFNKHKISVNPLPEGFDTKNKIPQWAGTPNENRTNANAVFMLLGAESVSVADISPYENPDYLIDLNNKVGPEFDHKFDIIFDIGTLEHIFDVPTALENITRMLKPEGRVILVVPASNYIDHGFYQFSPTLFYDFFSCNGFNSFSCYLIEGNPLNYLRKGKIWKYTGFDKECPLITPSGVETFFTAIKQNTQKEFEKPIQRLYANCTKGVGGIKQESLVKRVWDRYWKFCPDFIETLLLKKFRKNNNLVLLGRF